MMSFIIFIALILFIIINLITTLVFSILFVIKKRKNSIITKEKTRIRRSLITLGFLIITIISFTVYSQKTSSTPPILDENNNTIEESIAQLQSVELNGRKEWISIRGVNKENPVLLFLAGGPGGTQMAAVRHDLSELEKHFVVVNWDQPGSGKSYNAIPKNEITTDTYIEDGYDLTKYLCNRFNKEKIYVVGESWGSALGIFLADKYPDLYHAFIGTGQMVDFKETEIIDYNKAIEIAKSKNDFKKIENLKNNGVPPYYGKEVTWKSAEYLNYLGSYMTHNPKIKNPGYNTFRDIFSSEYGVVDKVNYLRGIITTFGNVYPKLYNIDLREQFNNLNVPVYFFIGKEDINAPISLFEDYYEVLKAPVKEVVWFENSGHSPWINESEKFIEEIIKIKDIFK